MKTIVLFMAEFVKRKWIVPVVFLALCLSAVAAETPGNIGLGTCCPSAKLTIQTAPAPIHMQLWNLWVGLLNGPPPMPTLTVKRPAPLLSPRAASAPKSAPMLRFTPASGYDVPGLAPTLPPTFQTNLTIIQIDGSAVQRDLARVIAKQRVGKGIRVEYTDGVPSSTGTWEFLADWGPQVEEQIIVTERYTDPAVRAQARFFRVVEYTAPAILSESGGWVLAGRRPPYKINPAMAGVQTWALPQPKKK